MAVDPRYEILFEPVRIGPVTAPNRFYQVPHCTGMGYNRPNGVAAMRETKAEGGWGVVCTEYCSIHPSSDDAPLPSHSLWDDKDVRSHAKIVENVHRHGALAGVELCHGGGSTANLYSREDSLGPISVPCWPPHPVQCRVMDRRDIKNLRRWQVEAAKRARSAGFDIVYVYATHGFLVGQFLHPSNQRSDEYGGSLRDRVRLLREMIEDTKEAVGDTCAVAVRFSADNAAFDEDSDNEENRAALAVVTPPGRVAECSYNTDEELLTQMRLKREGIRCETLTMLSAVGEKSVELSCIYTGDTRELMADHVVMVTSREPNDALYHELCDEIDIERVGDCSAPGIIASAVLAGHRYAREMDAPAAGVPFRRDDPVIVD